MCRYEEELEAYFDEAYDRYCKAKEGSSRRRARARLQGDEAEAAESDAEDDAVAEEQEEEKAGEGEEEDDGFDGLAGEEEGEAPGNENPLLVKEAGQKETAHVRGERMASQWFSQDVFQGLEMPAGTSSAPVFQGLEMPAETSSAPGASDGDRRRSTDKASVAEKVKGSSGGGVLEAVREKKDKKGRKEKSDSEEQEVLTVPRTKGGKVNGLSAAQEGTEKPHKDLASTASPASAGPVATILNGKHARGQGKHKGEDDDVTPSKGRVKGKAGDAGRGLVAVSQDDGDFEVVPAAEDLSDSDSESEGSESDSDSDDEGRPQVEINDEDYDTDAKAETLAYAHRMLRKRQREDIIDSAYNRCGPVVLCSDESR